MDFQKRFLGIDIGGTTAKYSLVSGKGHIKNRGQFYTGQMINKAEFMDQLFEVIDQALEHDLYGIGICTLGIVHSKTGHILGGVENLPFLHGLNLKEACEKRYGEIPIKIINDVKAIALAEQWMGAAVGCKDFCCIALGTGVGGAIVIDSKLVEGAHYRAGEIGYLDYNSEHDYLEKHISTHYVMKRAASELKKDCVDGFVFFDLVRDKDPIALKILEGWVNDISRLIANIVVVLDLEKVIIGGGISEEREILIPRIRAQVEKMLPVVFQGQTSIETAKLTNDAGMLGAVSMLIQQGQ